MTSAQSSVVDSFLSLVSSLLVLSQLYINLIMLSLHLDMCALRMAQVLSEKDHHFSPLPRAEDSDAVASVTDQCRTVKHGPSANTPPDVEHLVSWVSSPVTWMTSSSFHTQGKFSTHR